MGHAYSTCVADVLARYHRLVGDETYFLTGTDENSSKVIKKAEAEGKTPEIYTKEVVDYFKDFYKTLNISYDQFIQTSDKEIHWPGAKAVWQNFKEGDIYKSNYTGLYCVGAETFVTEKDLVNGKCPDHDELPQEIKEENYFFKLSDYSEKIKEVIENGEMQILPNSRKNEILSLLDSGLQNISFSRPSKEIPWGIPVPGDDSQTMYVWCDALTNYLSALGYGRGEENFKKFWPADVHVIGKDILRFHAAIWPAMLLSAGLPLPKKLLVHGMILSGGKKMSKTLGNTLDPKYFIDKYGTDALRYFLVREISPFEDGDMTEEKFKEAYTANLVNGIGNLTSRILKMSEDHLGECPELPEKSIPQNFKDAFEELNIQKAGDIVWQKVGELDQRIQDTEPFKLIKTNPDEAKEIIRNLVIDLYIIGRMLEPILPETSVKIKEAVKTNKKPEVPLFGRV